MLVMQHSVGFYLQ